MKKLIFPLVFLLANCAYGGNMVLEYKDVQFFKVRETQSVPSISLEVSGLAFHSSLAAESIETKIDNNCMVILVHLTPARNGLTGNFTYNFVVPKEIDSVYFGATKHLIWKRGVGVSFLKPKSKKSRRRD